MYGIRKDYERSNIVPDFVESVSNGSRKYYEGSNIVLDIDESVLNVFVFIGLNLIVLPALEVLTDMLMCRLGTLALLQGKTVCLCDTRLGVLTLYSTYFGQRRNLFFLILLGSMVIAVEMFTEFCLSSTQTRIQEKIRVWGEVFNVNSGALKPLFLDDPFKSSESFQFNVAPLDNDLFTFQTGAMACVEGDFQLKPKSFDEKDTLHVMVSHPYASGGPFRVHDTHITDESATVCDYDHPNTGWVDFEMPGIVRHGNSCITSSVEWRSLLGEDNRINWGPRLSIKDSLYSTYRGDYLACVGVNEIEDDFCETATERVICIRSEYEQIPNEYKFAYGEGYMLRKQDAVQRSHNQSFCPGRDLVLDINLVRVYGKISGVDGYYRSFVFQHSRFTIFLMTLLWEGFVGLSENEMLEVKRVQDILRLFLNALRVDVLINGAGSIQGMREHLGTQYLRIGNQLSQTPIVSKRAWGPLTLVVSTAALQIILIHYCMRRISTTPNGHFDEKFDTSMQYFRLDLLRKLQDMGIRAELRDVALRLVRQHEKWRIRLLPDLSSIQQPA